MNYPKRINIFCKDNVVFNTKVFDADTGEEFPPIIADLTISIPKDSGFYIAKVTVIKVDESKINGDIKNVKYFPQVQNPDGTGALENSPV